VPVFVIDFAPAEIIPTILDCNAAACATTGYTRDELLGQPMAKVSASPLDPEERQESTERMLRGEQVTFRSLRRHRDGTLTPVEVLACSILFEGRMVTLSTDRPLPAPRDGFDQSRRNLRLQMAMENAEMAVWDWRLGSGEETSLLSAESGFGAVVQEDEPAVRRALDCAAEKGEACRVEFRAHRHQGPVRWLEGRSVPVRDLDGVVVGLLGTVMDITERKELELALTRQSRLHEALAGCLRELFHPGGTELERHRLLAAVMERLRSGLGAPRVNLWSVEPRPHGRLLLMLAEATGMPPPAGLPEAALGSRPLLPWDEVEPATRAMLAQGQALTLAGCGLAAAQAGKPAAQGGSTYLFPILLSGDLWGLLEVEVEAGVALSEQEQALARTVAEMIQIAATRWHTLDSLTASEERLRLALEAAELGLWEWNFKTRRVEWTEQTARLFGIALTEHDGTLATFTRYAHPDDLEHIQASIARAVAVREPTRYALRIVRPDGEVRWLETLGQVYVDDEEQPMRMLGVAMDITERRATEETLQQLNTDLERRVFERTAELEQANRALHGEIRDRRLAEGLLRERERFLERVMAATPAQVFIFDVVTPRTLYSNRALESLGYGPDVIEQYGPFPIASVMHPDDAARLPAQYARLRAMADEEVLENEFRFRHADGTWHWLATRDVVFTRSDDGRPVQILGAAIDITAIKRAEMELAESVRRIEALNGDLRRSSQLLATIVNSLSDGLALIDRHGVVLMANAALARLYGVDLDAIVERPWATLCQAAAPLVGQTFHERTTATSRLQLDCGDAKSITVDLQTFPLLATDGSVEQVVLHLVDVTQRLQLEALAIQNERLVTTGRLAAIVAHEVNSPLQSIQNFLFLASSDDPEERDGYLRMISDEIDRIGSLIRRLLDLNRPGEGDPKPLDLNELVEKILVLTAGNLARHRVQLSCELAAQPATVMGRADHLTQVMLNIFLNALEAMPQGGRLKVRTFNQARLAGEALPPSLAGPMVTIEVSDTGPGISPDSLPLIFKPFYTTKPDGSGIGLAISHQIVAQHGGLLTAHNQTGGGAIFSVSLPVAPGALAPA
jgi:PAS domain S-box-containing protein